MLWFNKIQTQLPGDITLRDPWLYPDQGAPTDDTFRRRAWALLSLVGSQIYLPEVGFVFLRVILIEYGPYSIMLEVSKASDTEDTTFLPLPKDLQSDVEAFDAWMGKAEVPLHDY